MGKLPRTVIHEFTLSQSSFSSAEKNVMAPIGFSNALITGIKTLAVGMNQLSVAIQGSFVDVKKELNELDIKLQYLEKKINYIHKQHERQARKPVKKITRKKTKGKVMKKRKR